MFLHNATRWNQRRGWSFFELQVGMLDGPPPPGFDCGRAEQNSYFYDYAWHDQQESVSTTFVFHHAGRLAAFATICMASLPLSRRERGTSIRFREVGALKLAQLGVDRSFQAQGIGRTVVSFVLELARQQMRLGYRYVIVDAKPDLVRWYEGLGFVRNVAHQEERMQKAMAHSRDPDSIPVSMRFDLRRP